MSAYSEKTTKNINHQRTLLIVLSGWFLLNLLQAYFTGLIHDEAYYWVYTKHLNWGYFDHPPGVALFIKAGYALLGGELGLRLMVVISNTLAIWIMWELIKNYTNNIKLFFLVVFSIILVHVGGFIAVPDTALIFFTAVFFYFYRKYLNEDNLKYTLILAVIVACMLYSKYHGILVVFFTLISNLQLLKRKSFWAISILALLLFFPHIYWQYLNGFPSLKYHLAGRSKEAYNIEFTLAYLGGQLLIAGPLAGVFLFYACWKQKPEDLLLKGLKYTFWGIVLFFLFSSFKGRVEANWTAAAFIPMIVLSTVYASENSRLRNILKKIAIPGILLIFLFRISFAFNFVPDLFFIQTEVHHWDTWARQIKKKAKGAPVVFMNSYQKASKYSFYTGDESYSLNNVYYRKNQYNLWNEKERYFQGKKVMFLPSYPTSYSKELETVLGTYYYTFIDNYHSFDYIHCEVEEKKIQMNAGDTVILKVRITNTSDFVADFKPQDDFYVFLSHTIEQGNKVLYTQTGDVLKENQLKPGDSFYQQIIFIAPLEVGKYDLMISLNYQNILPTLNGDYIKLEVK
ncbi:MAG: glycosyltransferase family 39 protein [Bacteroidetes bacterium]|nr:glycosyltransferase family 39 protein [Bacteroidota bacterium]HET6245972.1 glycosyltransferase family 39 protein [Bacteroidia bacterium]